MPFASRSISALDVVMALGISLLGAALSYLFGSFWPGSPLNEVL